MPALLVTRCPHCKAKFKVQPKAAGRNTTCARCQKRFKISAAGEDFDLRPEEAFDLNAEPEDEVEFELVDEDFDGEDFDEDDDYDAEFGPELPRLPVAAKKVKKKKPPAAETKKTRKKRKSGGFNPVIPIIIGGVCVMGVGGMLLLPLVKNLEIGGGGIEPPTEYAHFFDERGQQFGIDYPKGWEVESGARGGTSNPWARFTHDSAKIRVKTSLGASAIAGDVSYQGPDDETPDELKSVFQIHKFMEDQFAGEYNSYEEKRPQVIRTGYGEVCLGEFTARGTWGSKIRGLRLSALGKNYQITVICDCAESDWEVCGPVFDRVVKSLGRR